VTKYNKYIKEETAWANLLAVTAQLANIPKEHWTTEHDEQWENLDQCYTQIKVNADRQCQKIHARQVPWTPILTQAIHKILYWKGIHKQISGSKLVEWCSRNRLHKEKKIFKLNISI